MENKQIYRISLTDYACPGFYSGSKDYYGTMEDIVALISAIKFNKSIDYDIDGLVVALEKYQAGKKQIVNTTLLIGKHLFLHRLN